jgi:hypothetical protein
VAVFEAELLEEPSRGQEELGAAPLVAAEVIDLSVVVSHRLAQVV